MYKSGICGTKPAISYLWNKTVYMQSYYRVSTKTRVRSIDWWQIWWPRVNFGPLFWEQIFYSGYLAHFLWEHNEIWPSYDMNLGPGSRDTMRRHASIFHWCTFKELFRQLPMFTDSFNVVTIHCVSALFPRIRCIPLKIALSYRGCGLSIWFLGPTRILNPNGISIGFTWLTTVTDRQTDRPRYSVCKMRPHLHTQYCAAA